MRDSAGAGAARLRPRHHEVEQGPCLEAIAEHEIYAILATHAAIAVEAARDKERAEQLDRAVESNREIRMAMGVLIARERMTREQAFAVLRRASQHLNRKLRDVAAEVVDTGSVPDRATRRG